MEVVGKLYAELLLELTKRLLEEKDKAPLKYFVDLPSWDEYVVILLKHTSHVYQQPDIMLDEKEIEETLSQTWITIKYEEILVRQLYLEKAIQPLKKFHELPSWKLFLDVYMKRIHMVNPKAILTEKHQLDISEAFALEEFHKGKNTK